MSAGQDARPHERRRERAAAPSAPRVGLVISRALFTSDRWPFAIIETGLFALFFQVGIALARVVVGEQSGPSLLFGATCAFLYGALALGLGSYDLDQRFRPATIVRMTALAMALAAVGALLLTFWWRQPPSVAHLLSGLACATVGLLAFRTGLMWLASRFPYRFSVYGTSPMVDEAVRYLQSHPRSAVLNRLVPITTIAEDPSRPSAAELATAQLAAVVVAGGDLSEDAAVHLSLACLEAGVPAVDERAFYATSLERMPIDDVPERWFLEQGLSRPHSGVIALKRLSDIGLSLVLLLALAPLLIAIIVGVRLSSPGPVFYVQDRQGRFLRPFRMLKFRTMRFDPDAQTEFTSLADARVTRIGRVLRRAHADELPQLVNILRGDMAVVGPRPEVLDFALRMEREVPLYELRYLVRPGLTGHAQLKQGYAMDTVEDTRTKLSYDLFYLCYYSLRMDVRILLRTAMFLIRGSR